MEEYLTPIEEALDIIKSSVVELGSETVFFNDSRGRVVAVDVISPITIPPLDNSAMDGYVMKYEDVRNASIENPVELTVVGEIQAGGEFSNYEVKCGTAIRIMTGAPIPAGGEVVIPREDLLLDSENLIKVKFPMKMSANVRFAGEDIEKGMAVLKKGDRITTADVGLLASMNIENISVVKKPQVAIIATGDEIVEPGQNREDGQIYNSNAYTLQGLVEEYGGDPHYLGIASDSDGALEELLTTAMKYDIIVTTGGVSMGRYDLVKGVVRRLGFDITIENMRMKPGKPVAFGSNGEKMFFGLPGNPVSTMVAAELFLRSAILWSMGATKVDRPILDAEIQHDIKKKPGRRHYNRGYYSVQNGKLVVSTTGDQGSGILRSMNLANCMVVIGEDFSLITKGEIVKILLFKHEEI